MTSWTEDEEDRPDPYEVSEERLSHSGHRSVEDRGQQYCYECFASRLV